MAARSRFRIGLLVAVVLVASSFLSACAGGGDGSSTGSTSASSGSNAVVSEADMADPAPLTIGSTLQPLSLNPAQNSYEGITLNSIAYESLIKQQSDGSFKPGLATSWGYVGTGNKTFKLTLRRDARFSDGTPVNAAAVKKWLEYFPTAQGAQATYLDIASIDTPDNWSVVLKMATPTPDLPVWLGSMHNWGDVASPKAVARPGSLARATFGAGQYVFDPAQSTTGVQYTYLPNRYYFDQSSIRFSKVVFKVITSPSTMLRAVETGQLDAAMGDLSTAGAAEAAGLRVVRGVGGNTSAVLLFDRSGKTEKPLADVRVRQALNYAIDRTTIARAIAGKYATPTSQLIPTNAGLGNQYANYYKYDPEKAKALLREAGYPNGFTLPIMTTPVIGQLGQPTTLAVAKYLNDVGIKVRVDNETTLASFTTKAIGGKSPAASQWQASPVPVAVFYKALWMRDGLLNRNGVNDPVITAAYERAQTAKDAAPYWRKIMARSVTDATAVPIYASDALWFAKPDIGGIEPSAQTVGMAIFDGWYRTRG